jgi:hypothetical protein
MEEITRAMKSTEKAANSGNTPVENHYFGQGCVETMG